LPHRVWLSFIHSILIAIFWSFSSVFFLRSPSLFVPVHREFPFFSYFPFQHSFDVNFPFTFPSLLPNFLLLIQSFCADWQFLLFVHTTNLRIALLNWCTLTTLRNLILLILQLLSFVGWVVHALRFFLQLAFWLQFSYSSHTLLFEALFFSLNPFFDCALFPFSESA
jgi:hypothetical protein